MTQLAGSFFFVVGGESTGEANRNTSPLFRRRLSVTPDVRLDDERCPDFCRLHKCLPVNWNDGGTVSVIVYDRRNQHKSGVCCCVSASCSPVTQLRRAIERQIPQLLGQIALPSAVRIAAHPPCWSSRSAATNGEL